MARKKTSHTNHLEPAMFDIPPLDWYPDDVDPIAINPLAIEVMLRPLLRYLNEHGINPDDSESELAELAASGKLQAILDAPPEMPIERAMNIVLEAYDTVVPRRRRKLALKALKICPDCADAYMALATASPDLNEAREFYQQAIDAAGRMLDPEELAAYDGMLWDTLDGRPYLRALNGMATVLWLLDEPDEAIRHAREVLRLDATDPCDMRLALINWLMVTGKDRDARTLLNDYRNDDDVGWLFSRALLDYRRSPKSGTARKSLLQAMDANPHVAIYLLGLVPSPAFLSPFSEPGEASEAVYYVKDAIEAWYATPNALDWLSSVFINILDTPPGGLPPLRSSRPRRR